MDRLNQLLDQFLRERVYLHNITPKTHEFYETARKAFRRSRAGTHPKDSGAPVVTRNDLQEFVIHLRERGVKPVSCNCWLRGLNPTRWRAKLSEWRGIYYIFDSSDGKAYVGSAYGDTNLLGRWVGYGSTGHGGNRFLRERDPRTFRFSIRQRVSPDMDAADVIRLEATWKERLHTRAPSGLNDN